MKHKGIICGILAAVCYGTNPFGALPLYEEGVNTASVLFYRFSMAVLMLAVCSFAAHSICDVLPMFWGKNMAVVATDGNVDQGMIVFMMTLSYLIPACGVLCMLWKARALKVINAVLAVFIGLFNIAHAFMELPSDNAGQYVVMPMMIIVGIVLAWYSIKYVQK